VDERRLDKQLLAAFGEPAARALHDWMQQEDRALRVANVLPSGTTDAKVAVVFVETPNEPARKLILKLCPPGIDEVREPGKHRRALRQSPREFVRRHLVELPINPVRVSDQQWLMFQDIAGGGLAQLTPLSTVLSKERGSLAASCTTIVSSVLEDWNTGGTTSPIMPVPMFLRQQLGGRLRPGGSLWTWAALQPTLIASPKPWLNFPGEPTPLPNPLVLTTDDGIGKDLRIDVLKGHAHGDLHLENILLPIRPKLKASDFRLIDLSNYSESAPLSRDPIHLLLSIVARDLPDMEGDSTRRELAHHLIEPGSVEPVHVHVGLWQVIHAIQKAGRSWIAAQGLVDDWDALRPLSLVACALMFAGRRFSERDRWWFYWLAAKSASAYLDAVGRNHPEDPHTIHVPHAGQSTDETKRPTVASAERLSFPPRSTPAAQRPRDNQGAEPNEAQRSLADPGPPPSDLEGLSEAQRGLLGNSVRAFANFLAWWDELVRTPRFSQSHAEVKDAFRESLQQVGEQFRALQMADVHRWPHPGWAGELADVRQTAERAFREVEARFLGDAIEPSVDEADPQGRLRQAVAALQALMTERYPSAP
jgi:hypothetical protein